MEKNWPTSRRWMQRSVCRLKVKSLAAARSGQKLVVFRMMANPEPVQPFRALFGNSAVMGANPRCPKSVRIFQAQGRMPWILLQQLEIFPRKNLNGCRQTIEMVPKLRRGEMPHSGRHRPCSNARSAASPNLSNLPACASAANRCSHFSAR